MRIAADLHVHTIASGHAYSTLADMVRGARERGLDAIAILDHGPGLPGGAHEYYFSNLRVLPAYIDGVRVFRGAEANIVGASGELDISDFTLELLEFVGVSLHPGCGFESAGVVTNTDAVLAALSRPNVRLICHPTVPGFEIDIVPVVEAACERGVLIELNNYSFDSQSFRAPRREDNIRLLEICAEHGCLIAVNSDAHFHTLVGEVSYALEAIEAVGFPEELIVNTSLARVESYLYHLAESNVQRESQ